MTSAEADGQPQTQPSAASDEAKAAARWPWLALLLPLLVAAFLLFLVLAVALVFAIGQLNESRLTVARVLEAQSQALSIRLLLRQAESSQRGFLLTGDDSFLNEYQAWVAPFADELSKLDRRVMRPDQQERLNTISRLANEKFDDMNQKILLAQSGRRDEVLALLRSGHGEELMTEINRQFDDFLSVVAERLQIRQQEAESNLRLMWGLGVLAAGAMLALGVLVGALARMQFVSLQRSEAALRNLNRELEARVVERTFELEAARDRAETLLRDVNHRVGNNLALVSSFLGLQMRAVSDEASRRALASARNRVHTIATTQRKLRLGGGSDTTRIDALLKEVIDDLVAATPGGDRVTIDLESDPLDVPADDAVSVSVIVSELVMNAVKYAFPTNMEGRVVVRLQQAADGAMLTVEDNGVGKAEPVDTGSVGLGSQIIFLLCKQFGGEPVYESGSGADDRRGLVVIVPLPSLKIESQQS